MHRARAIILNGNGEILLGNNTSDLFVLPGGKIKPNEHPVDAVMREVAEETGITRFVTLKYLWPHQSNHVFLYIPSSKQHLCCENDPCKEFQSLTWFSLDRLPSNLDPYTEDILYKYFRNLLHKPQITQAGHIDVLIDGRKVYELEDDVIWLTLPRLAQERAKGRKIEFRQVLDDGQIVDQTPNPMPVTAQIDYIEHIIDDLMCAYIPEETVRPGVEIVDTDEYLAKTVWNKDYSITIKISEQILDDNSVLRQVLAHEIIHVHLYAKFGKQVAKHGEHFKMIADRINQTEGENYISEYADFTRFDKNRSDKKHKNIADSNKAIGSYTVEIKDLKWLASLEPVNVTDKKHVVEIANSFKEKGWDGPPILYSKHHHRAITGSHRIAAAKVLLADADNEYAIDVEAIDVDPYLDEYCDAHNCTIDQIEFSMLRWVFEGTDIEDEVKKNVEW